MDQIASVVEGIKGFVASGAGFLKGMFPGLPDSSTKNPIEILKRLQRESFCDLMRLRDGQDKIERMVSIYKTVKGSPFLESSTHMKGIVDVSGALLFVENDDRAAFDTLDKAGAKTGIDSRFIFETTVRQKDALLVEFLASQSCVAHHGDVAGSPLALSKVMYSANINDQVSVASIPLGARCIDFEIGSISTQGQRLCRFSSFLPPMLSQYHTCGAGLIVRGSNISASLAELVSGLGPQSDAVGNRSWLSTFWHLNYQPSEEARLALSCIWQIPRSSLQMPKLGTLAIPVGRLKPKTKSDAEVQASSAPTGSFALILESDFDENITVGGWVEVQKLSPRLFQWGFSVLDIPEDELGWGLRLGGNIDGHANQFHLEGFLNFNLGKRVSLQPGVLYATDGGTRTPALLFRSSWSM